MLLLLCAPSLYDVKVICTDRHLLVRGSVRSPSSSSRRLLSRSWWCDLSYLCDYFFVLRLLLRECFFFPCLLLTRGVCFSRRAAALRALSIARASVRFVVSTSCVSASSASPTLISCDRRPARLRFSASRSLFRWARSIGRSLVLTTKVNFVPSTGLCRPVPVD